MARSLQSRRDLGNLDEISAISPRSRRDLESKKHHGEISSISARSRRSRRDLADLGEISVKILHGFRQSKHDVICHAGNVKAASSLFTAMYGGYFPTNDVIFACFKAFFAWLAKISFSSRSLNELDNSVLLSKSAKNTWKT